MNERRTRQRQSTPTKIRPYVITRGRTRSSRPLGVETMLRTVAYDVRVATRLLPEEGELYRLCLKPVSIAELANAMRMPLGMVRVVADDLSRQGLVEILPDASGGADIDLLRRVHRGLANLSV